MAFCIERPAGEHGQNRSTGSSAKRTIYKYFPSKIDLFQAALMEMGKDSEAGFLDHLENTDTEIALRDFAIEFIKAHMTKNIWIPTGCWSQKAQRPLKLSAPSFLSARTM